MQDIYIHLPYPPSSRAYYWKGRILTRIGRLYSEQVAEVVIEQRVNLHIDEPVAVTTVLYPPDKRTRDLDNCLKALQDALTRARVWVDDGQINQGHQYRGAVVKKGACVVLIQEAGPILPFGYDLGDL